MSTRVSVYNHPIHPMLIAFPIGLWVFSVVSYGIFLAISVPVWRTVSLYTMGGGVIGGILAAVPGTIDFLTRGPSRALTIAMTHMVCNTVALTIFTISLVYEHGVGVSHVSSRAQAEELVEQHV